ncbi:MAG: hypothetical protein C0616_13650 [Desulfuromonas sp.]|nr:MAG: hypothetical protein C0616_13650 [Desulfuromonas sp.]
MTRYLIGFVLFLFTISSTYVHAEDYPLPMVDYSADTVMKVTQRGGETMTIPGKIYFSAGKERREMEMMGRTSVLIQRPDRGVTWLLMPAQKMYMEYTKVPTNQHQDPAQSWKDAKVEKTRVGSETINGVSTEKYRIRATGRDGSVSSGFLWLTPENIPMKVEGMSNTGDEDTDFYMEYRNLAIESQPPHLFEIPRGFTKFQTGGYGAGFTPGPPVGTMQPDAPSSGMGGMGQKGLEGLPPGLREKLEQLQKNR